MLFILGVLCGVGIALAVRGVLLAVGEQNGVKKQTRSPSAAPDGWQHTRNFLYYDGTVMPTSKEDNYE